MPINAPVRPFCGTISAKQYEDFLREGTAIKKGKAVCPSCGKIIFSHYIIRHGFLYLLKYCPMEEVYFYLLLAKAEENFFYFQDDIPASGTSFEIGGTPSYDTESLRGTAYNLSVPVTSRCNSDCAICYASYGQEHLCPEDPDLNSLKQLLHGFKNKRVCLELREPTVRDDLPEIVRLIKKGGNIPIVATNGLRLADVSYTHRLIAAGPERIYFSLDGFRDDFYENFKGNRDNLSLKLAALKNLETERIRTVLSVVLINGENTDQVKPLIDYASARPFICELLFRPLYLPGTNPEVHLGLQHLVSQSEFLELIRQATGIRKEYFSLFYGIKIALYRKLGRFFPVSVPAYSADFFLERTPEGLHPFLEIDQLTILGEIIEKNKWHKLPKLLLNRRFLRLLFTYTRSFFSLEKMEHTLARGGQFLRITWRPYFALPENENLQERPRILSSAQLEQSSRS